MEGKTEIKKCISQLKKFDIVQSSCMVCVLVMLNERSLERFSEILESKCERLGRRRLQAGVNPPLLLSQLAKFSEDTLSSYTEVVSSQVHPLYYSFSPSLFVSLLWIDPPSPTSYIFFIIIPLFCCCLQKFQVTIFSGLYGTVSAPSQVFFLSE